MKKKKKQSNKYLVITLTVGNTGLRVDSIDCLDCREGEEPCEYYEFDEENPNYCLYSTSRCGCSHHNVLNKRYLKALEGMEEIVGEMQDPYG
jgi:hypothetical protein